MYSQKKRADVPEEESCGGFKRGGGVVFAGQGVEANHKVDLMKVAHELESTKLALADVTKVQDEKDAALSIVQQDRRRRR